MTPRKKATKKKSVGVRKKPPPKKPAVNAPAGTSEETNQESAKATGKADNVIKKDEDVSDRPARNTRAATKKGSKQGSTEPLDETSTAPTTITTSKTKPNKSADKTRATTKEPTSVPVNIPSEDEVPLANLKRQRATEDKWTETTDLPGPKSSKLDKGSSPRPFRKIRQLRMLDEFDSEGWDTKDFNIELCCIDTVDLSRIPSPLAGLADEADRIMHTIDNHVHPQVSSLFNRIYGGDNGDFAKLIEYLDESSHEGAFGALQSNGIGPRYFKVPPNTADFSLELNRRNRTDDGTHLELNRRNGTDDSTHLEVRVCRNARTGEIGYFLVNEQRNLFINENLIARNSMAGPLPDFAVIQVGYWVVFWWRSRAAMGYIPETMSQGVKDVEEDDATKEPSLSHPGARKGVEKGVNAAEESKPPLVSGSEKGEIPEVPTRVPTRLPTRPLPNWKEILDSGVRRHDAQRITAGERDGYHKIKSPSGMDIDDVLFAVATFWEPLRNQGTNFAFAGDDVIDQNLRQHFLAEHLESFGVVGKGNMFIMPLIFPHTREDAEEGSGKLPESKGVSFKGFTESKKGSFESFENVLESKANGPITRGNAKKDKAKTDAPNSSSPLGHLLLAVVTKDSDSHNVNIDIYDSLAIHLDREVIRRRAREVARIWLQTEVKAEFHFKSVPQQPLGSDACGLYVILNAWAIMLDIRPISLYSDAHSRPGGCGSDKFVEDGLNIVNLALAGCMDSKTVRAFLKHYGYAAGNVRDPLEREGDPENGVPAVGMNRRLFNRALERAMEHSPDSINRIQLRSPSPLSAASSAPSNGTLTTLQDTTSEDSTGQGGALPGIPILQGVDPGETPGPQDALPETPGLQSALSEFQNERLKEIQGSKEQAPTKTTFLQKGVKFLQMMGEAHTDNSGLQDLQDAISKSAIQQFMDQAHGATLEQAKNFLETAGEDVEQALLEFGVYQSQL